MDAGRDTELQGVFPLWIDHLRQDVRHALRVACRRPALTVVALLTIAAGVGGATAIFSVADTSVLRPLPYAEPDQLVVIREQDGLRGTVGATSYPAFAAWRDESRSFESLAAATAEVLEVTVSGRGDSVLVEAAAVSGTFFQTLGARAVLGRTLLPADDAPDSLSLVVSHALWRDRLDADPAVIGESLVVGGRAYTIVGVMPPEFAYPAWAQLWIPLRSNDALLLDEIAEGLFEDEGAGVGWLAVIGRLRDDVTFDGLQAELTVLWKRMYRRSLISVDLSGVDPATLDAFIDAHTTEPTLLSDTILGPTRPVLLAIVGASVLVLLIACANVAGLLVMRAVGRRRELAVRLALGAGRVRLMRAALVESLLLALVGTVGGLVLAWWAAPLLASLAPAEIPRLDQIALDARVIGFAGGAAVLVAAIAALAQLALVRHASADEMVRRPSTRVAEGRSRVRAVLVVSQIALAVVLLVAAGLMIRSVLALREAPLGFDTERVLAVALAPRGERYAEREPRRIFFEELLQRVRALPGVESAGMVTRHPLWSTQGYDWPFTAEGQAEADALRNPPVNLLAVSSDYFRTMGIAVVRGRAFTEMDREGQPGVVVVGESLARQAWPGLDPIGRRLRTPMPGTPYQGEWLSVAGVAEDSRSRELDAARFDLYVSHLQANLPLNSLMVRTTVDPAELARAVRGAVRGLDPNVPVMETLRMSDVVSASMARWQFAARLFGAFGVAALALAALGLYALVAFAVAARTREMGLRMALGAQAADVRRLVLRYALRLTLPGLLIGLAAALLGGRAIETLLYGVSVRDPITLAIAPLLLAATAAIACLVTAIRATRVDPALVLREE